MSLRSADPALPFVDPSFDQGAFLEQTRAAFYTVKRAWAQLRPEISRHVTGEDLWQSQKAQMEVFRLDGCHNVLDGITVEEVRLGDALTVGTDDRIDVGLDLIGADYVVRDATGEVLRGDPAVTAWREVWTMERSRDPQLLAAARTAKCPECGSPLSLDPDGACQFCHAVVPGAKVDWLVVTMAHPTENTGTADPGAAKAARRSVMAAMAESAAGSPWTGHAPGPLPIDPGAEAGLRAIQAQDPGFAAGDFLARAREAFIRLDESRNEVTPEVIRPVVSDGFYAAELGRANAARSTGRNQVEAFLDVRKAELVTAESGNGRDRIVARITLTSAGHVIDINAGAMVGGDNSVRQWHSDLTFERNAGVQSDPMKGTGAALCGHCGQPGTVAEDGVCSACGEHVTGGEWDWVLVAEERQAG